MKKTASLMIHTVNEQHILYYTVSKKQNTAYEETELYEYGIRCALCDLSGRLMDEEEVPCISANLSLVHRLTSILAKYQVYPVHMLEILDDLLNLENLPTEEDLAAPRLCV